MTNTNEGAKIKRSSLIVQQLLNLSLSDIQELLKDPVAQNKLISMEFLLSNLRIEDFEDLSEKIRFNIANYLETIGEIIGLVNHLKLAFDLFGTISNKSSNYGKSLLNRGIILLDLAELGVDPVQNLELAVNLLDKALQNLSESSPDYNNALMNKAIALVNLAELEKEPIHNLETAIDMLDEVIQSIPKKTPSYGLALLNKGIALMDLAEFGVNVVDNLNSAVSTFDKALQNLQPETLDYSKALVNKANVLIHLTELEINPLQNLQQAEKLYLSALEIFEKAEDRINIIKTLENLGIIYYISGDHSNAYNVLKRAVEMVESIRSEMLSPGEKKVFQETFISIYQRILLTCLKLGKEEEAFTYAERAKSRTFIEMLVGGFETDDETAKKIDKLLRKLEDIEVRKKVSKDEKELQGIEIERKKIIIWLDELYDHLYRENPELYGAYRVQTITPAELKDIENSVLMFYETSEGVIGFLVNDGKLTVKNLGEVKAIGNFLEALAGIYDLIDRGVNPVYSRHYQRAKELLGELYERLIRPFEGELKESVIIIPHSRLHYVPFAALFDGKRYLIEKYNVKLAPSATSVKLLHSKRYKVKKALVVGNPTGDLPNAEVEAQRVAQMLGQKGIKTEVIIGENATRAEVRKKLGEINLLHYSGHAFFNPEEPKLSGLVLADGVFTMLDFLSTKLNTGLVVLSACETGMAKTSKGDEREGLVRAIQLAGAKYIIGTLWPVEDEAARLVFEEFYSSDGDFAERLKRAQERLLRGEKPEFYYWAPFHIYGA